MEELGEQCFTVVCVASRSGARTATCAWPVWLGRFAVLDEGVADDAGEVTAVKVLTGRRRVMVRGIVVTGRPSMIVHSSGTDGGLVDFDVGRRVCLRMDVVNSEISASRSPRIYGLGQQMVGVAAGG